MASPSYFSSDNLKRALGLGALVTAMAIPRLQVTDRAQPLSMLTLLVGMTIVGGAATAWGGAAGMPGCWPGARRAGAGALVGLGVGLLLAIAFVRIDLPLRGALTGAQHAEAMARAFPPDTRSRIAALLWTAGMETLFFQAAATSYFARLTGVRPAAIAAAALFRGFIAYEQAVALHIDPATMVAGHVGLAAVGSALFAWGGFPAASVFAAAVASRVFW